MGEAITAFGSIGFWGELLLVLLAGCGMRITYYVIRRGYRTIKVLARGWPPAHLDADGDFRPIKGE